MKTRKAWKLLVSVILLTCLLSGITGVLADGTPEVGQENKQTEPAPAGPTSGVENAADMTSDEETVSEETASTPDGLDDCLADEETVPGQIKLSTEKLSKRFGGPVSIRKNEDTPPYPSEGGYIVIPVGDEETFVYVEEDKENGSGRVLWAGKVTQDGKLRALIYHELWDDGAETDQGWYLDVAPIQAEMGKDIQIQCAIDDGRYKYLELDDDGRVFIQNEGETMYLYIDRANNKEILWAGVISLKDIEIGKNIIFNVYMEAEQTESASEEDVRSTAEEPETALEDGAEEQAEFVEVTEEASGDAVEEAAEDAAEEATEDATEEAAEDAVAEATEDAAENAAENAAEEVTEDAAENATEQMETVVIKEEPEAELGFEIESIDTAGVSLRFSEDTREVWASEQFSLEFVMLDENDEELEPWNVVEQPEMLEDGRYAAHFPENVTPGKHRIKLLRQGENVFSLETEIEQSHLNVQLLDYTGIYDGMPHGPEMKVSEEETVAFYYAPDNGTEPLETDWKEGLPQQTEAGQVSYYLKAGHEDRRIQYSDAQGQVLAAENGYVKACVEIQEAPITVCIKAEAGEMPLVYTGKEQEVQLAYHAEISGEAAELFDAGKITSHDNWVETEEKSFKDAGEFSVEIPEDRYAYIKTADANFEVTLEFQNAIVTVNPMQITLRSGSDAIVYDADANSLRVDEKVQGADDIAQGDYYSGNITADGKQTGVGIGNNRIVLSGRFAERQSNYAIDLQEGVLVVFPQSICSEDAAWDDASFDPQLYMDADGSDLPGYYTGMQIWLKENDNIYTGLEHTIEIEFRNRNGKSVVMTEGTDYQVTYLREGVETEDLISGGIVTVQIKGMGNYTGTVSLEYEITAAEIKNTEISMSGWTFDGKSADDASHSPDAEGEPTGYVYYDENGSRIDPPTDAGRYQVQGIWEQSANYNAAESPLVDFSIKPMQVKVVVKGTEIEVDDESGLFVFDKSMLDLSEGTYACDDKNFAVEVQIDALPDFEVEDAVGVLSIEDWTYDGEAANSTAHPVVFQSSQKDVEFVFFNEEGVQITAPEDAGSYKVEAHIGEEAVAETEFVIHPIQIDVFAADARKTYGEEDPQFVLMSADGRDCDDIDGELVREEGETPGEYKIRLKGVEEGNYEVLFTPGILTIVPVDISVCSAQVYDDDVIVMDQNGSVLMAEKDYMIDACSVANDGDMQLVIKGMGNYSGTLEQKCPICERTVTLTLTDGKGDELKNKGLYIGREGTATFSGSISSNAFIYADSLEICIDQQVLPAQCIAAEGNRCEFLVEGYMLDKNADSVQISVAIHDREYVMEEIKVINIVEKGIWLGLTVILLLSGLGCLIACVRLNRRLKKERLKLLDVVSRQSNRTIRENHAE